MSTLFIDNGGYRIVGLHSQNDRDFYTAGIPNYISCPNCIGTIQGNHYIGDSLSSLTHYHGLVIRRPVEKGFIVDAMLQAEIWSKGILQPLGILDEKDVDLVLTVPHGIPDECIVLLELLCFRYFNFRSLRLVSSAFLALVGSYYKKNKDLNEFEKTSGIVVDIGYSGTTITPFIKGDPVIPNIVRIEVGGKMLTNYLNQILSFNQVDLTANTWIVNFIKEKFCSTANDFKLTMKRYKLYNSFSLQKRKSHLREWDDFRQIYYALPSIAQTQPFGVALSSGKVGSAKAQGITIIVLRHEIYAVPEALFHPLDVGLHQCGVAECVSRSLWSKSATPLYKSPSLIQNLLLSNIIMIGGTATCLDNYINRFSKEIRADISETINFNVSKSPYNFEYKIENLPFILLGALRLFFSFDRSNQFSVHASSKVTRANKNVEAIRTAISVMK